MLTPDEMRKVKQVIEAALVNAALAEVGELAQGGQDTESKRWLATIYHNEQTAAREALDLIDRELAKE